MAIGLVLLLDPLQEQGQPDFFSQSQLEEDVSMPLATPEVSMQKQFRHQLN
jgi:hypothetical protein